jgi:hypothetical protein
MASFDRFSQCAGSGNFDAELPAVRWLISRPELAIPCRLYRRASMSTSVESWRLLNGLRDGETSPLPDVTVFAILQLSDSDVRS